MPNRVFLFASILGCWLLSGCGIGEPYVVKSSARELPQAVQLADPRAALLKIAVAPFEDARTQGRCSAMTRSFWGGETAFPVIRGNLGGMVTLMVIDAFKRQKGWDAWLDTPGVTAPDGGADVTLKGEVLQCGVVAESLFGVTTITAGTQMAVYARNKADGSDVRVDLSTTVDDWVFWFEPDDAEAPVGIVLYESLAKLISDTRVENRRLRLRPER